MGVLVFTDQRVRDTGHLNKKLPFQFKVLLFALLPFGLSKKKALISSQYFFLLSYCKKKTVIFPSAAT